MKTYTYAAFLLPPVLLALFGAAGSSRELASDKPTEKVQYNRDIRPILAENCFACHGPDSASRKAKLRLDQRDAAIKAEVIKPGNAADSEIIKRINAGHDEVMPPLKTKKQLTAVQKELLRKWVAEGAEYQPHWSYLKPVMPDLPAVKNAKWARNPIDRFVLAKLEAAGLQPAAEADRRTLARRLSLDLTGLPPTPADVEKFVNDKTPDAYEKYVDRLMDSPAWGEHRGRYWLDAVRYADTHGLHFDNYREMWAYRDWVIDAFNRNLPFDQFTVEQLAGDLLPNPTLDQLVASGFNRCNVTTNEGGTIAEENLVLYTRDRTETVAQIWLGLTVGCAVCHDHKFDTFSARDFYSLSAFFNNGTAAALDGNVSNTPPIIFVPRREDRPRWEELDRQLTKLRDQIEGRKKLARGDFDKWLAKAGPDQAGGGVSVPGLRFLAPLDEGAGKVIHFTVDGKDSEAKLESGFDWSAGHVAAKAFAIKPGPSVEVPDLGDFEKNQAFSIGAWVKTAKRGQTGAIAARMDNTNKHRGWDLWMENDRVGMHIINAWPENALKVTTRMALKQKEWHHVMATYDGSGKAAGVKVYVDGALQATDVIADKLTQTIRTKVPFKIGQRQTSERLADAALQDLRVYDQTLRGPEVEQLARSSRAKLLLARPANKRTPAEVNELFVWWLPEHDQPYCDLNEKLAKLQPEEVALRSRGAVTHVMKERDQPAAAFILFRGDYDKRRDKVPAATPAILPAMPPELPRNRLGFAKWLLQPDNPLTARVTVNRFWQEIFGTGLVRTAGDFGVSGETPSHPELLDWLALEFRDKNWDVKQFFKLVVTSAAYRQAAVVTKEKAERDPHNLLLSRGPRYRMDAEMIRDYALASSGLLVRKLGGPSVKPYQPAGVWEVSGMAESNTRNYKRDNGDSLYRRSVYTFWKRGAPPASMDILNAPSREFCVVRRERTNTPLQALVTLNDPQFIEAARHLAEMALKNCDASTASRSDFVARRLLSRPLRAEEQRVIDGLATELQAFYKAHPEDAGKLIAVGESRPDASLDVPTLAAWTMAVNQMMNLDEVLSK